MARGWTEWTQGFQFGAAILQFDATGDAQFLELGRTRTLERMASHLTHVGVHDHGFNNVSTYGNLWRWRSKGASRPATGSAFLRARAQSEWRRAGPAMDAAARWRLHPFVQRPALAVRGHDPLVRSLALAHRLGHRLSEEQDAKSACWPAWSSTPRPPPASVSTTGGAAIPTTCAGAPRTRRSSTRSTARFAGPTASRVLAVQHVDPRAGLGDAGLCRAARVLADGQRRRPEPA